MFKFIFTALLLVSNAAWAAPQVTIFFRENPTAFWEQMSASQINFVPLALNSVQLEGFSSNKFLKIDSASAYTPLTATQVNTLMDIIAGTNTHSTDATGGSPIVASGFCECSTFDHLQSPLLPRGRIAKDHLVLI